MDIGILNAETSACDTFVSGMADSRIYHLPAWSRAVCRGAGLKEYYLVARESEKIHGVLPLAYVKSILFDNRMISQAFGNYGGPLFDSDQARDALFKRAVEFATELDCESIEFRNLKPLPYDLTLRSDKMCMYLPLSSEPEEIWKAFKPKVRNQVRKAEKSDVTAVSGGVELLGEFFGVYAIRMRQLGTPCYPRKMMQEIMRELPENCRIFAVKLQNRIIGAGFTMCFNGLVEIPWAATLVEHNKLCPNNLMYWAIIEHYCRAGARTFDFGRCTVGSATHRFKQQWGPEPVPLNYQYWLKPGKELTVFSPDNPKYQRKINLWKKMPVWLTRIVGPMISRKLP